MSDSLQITFSPEQLMLQEAAARYLDKEYGFAERQRIIESATELDARQWQAFADMGWLALPFAEADGGGGGNAIDLLLLSMAFGRALVVEPYLASVVLGGLTVARAGSAAQRALLLPGVMAGTTRLALAASEPHNGYDLCDVRCCAVAEGDGFVLNGSKSVVLGAAAANLLVVSARTSGQGNERAGLSLFLVARDAPGVVLRSYATIDGRRAAEVQLTDVRVDAQAVLGRLGEAAAHLDAAKLMGSIAVLGEAVGCLEGAVATTAQYLNSREQFGQKLAKFQALRHRVADMYVAKEETRALCLLAAQRVASGSTRAAEAVAAAKAWLGQTGRQVGEDAVQLHGAIAITDEYIAGHYLKRLIALDRLFGDGSTALDEYLALRGAFDDAVEDRAGGAA